MSRDRTMLASIFLALALWAGAACSSDSKSAGPTTAAAVASAAPNITTADTTDISVDTNVTTSATVDGPITTAATRPPDDTSDTTVGDTTTPATDAPTTETPTTETPTTEPPTTSPDVFGSIPGLLPIDLTAAGDDPQRPTFTWTAPNGAAAYQLVVQTADGSPVWAWTGEAITIGLGGDSLPADVEGPTLDTGGRARVYALDASLRVIAISPWLPLAAG